MNGGNFITGVLRIDVSKIRKPLLKRIKTEILKHKDWEFKKVKKASRAARELAIWLNSISEYQQEIQRLKPYIKEIKLLENKEKEFDK